MLPLLKMGGSCGFLDEICYDYTNDDGFFVEDLMNKYAIRVLVFGLMGLALVLASLACSLQQNSSGADKDAKTTPADRSAVKKETQAKALSAQDILDRSTEAMKTVKTLSLRMVVASGSAGILMEIHGEGVIEQPFKAYLKMDYAGETIEVLTISQTEAYIKQPGSASWEAIEASQLSQPGGMNVDVIQQLGIVGFADELELADPESIEGVDCYHITFSLDMTKYLSELGPAGAQIDATTAHGAGSIWVGQDDFLTRKFVFRLDAAVQGITVNASTEITLFDFNLPVEIPSP